MSSISPFWIFIIGAIALGTLLTIMTSGSESTRRKLLQEWAAAHNWSLDESTLKDFPDELKGTIIGDKREDYGGFVFCQNILSGEWNGYKTSALQLTNFVPRTAGSFRHVVYCRFDRTLSQLTVRPIERWKWLKKERRQRVRLMNAKKFNQTYQAYSADVPFITALLTEQVQSILLKKKVLSFEITNNTLAIFSPLKTGYPAEFVPLLDLLSELQNNLRSMS